MKKIMSIHVLMAIAFICAFIAVQVTRSVNYSKKALENVPGSEKEIIPEPEPVVKESEKKVETSKTDKDE